MMLFHLPCLSMSLSLFSPNLAWFNVSLETTSQQVDFDQVDVTTEEEIQAQRAADDKEVMMDAAWFARRACKKLGLSQML
jgi:hypothetical protein